MSDKEPQDILDERDSGGNPSDEAEGASAAEVGAADAETPEAAEADAEDSPPSAEERIADLEDKWRRALAEVHNIRRRAEEERRNAARYGIREFARDMLSVRDNLGRALEAAGAQEGETPEGEFSGGDLLTGIRAIHRELGDVMERHGVKEMRPMGEKFDPNFHEAVFEAREEDGAAFDKVVAVVQSGYMIGERLLRPAQVGVARARPEGSAGVSDVEAEAS